MITAGIRDVKNNLSRILRNVRNGEEVLVTDHGKPIARIVREPAQRKSLRERLSSRVEEGTVGLPSKQYRPSRRRPLPLRGKPLSEIVLEDRR